jgi:two-component system sensor histidine kinase DctS
LIHASHSFDRSSAATHDGATAASLSIASLHRRAQLGDAALTIAHELNNLMTPLITRADFALQSDDTRDHRHALERVLVQARRATEFAQRLVNYVRGGSLDLDTTPLRPILDDAVAIAGRPTARSPFELTCDVPPDVRVKAAPALLGQLFVNLIANARQAPGERNGAIRLAARAENGNVLVHVKDNGRGIASEQLHRELNSFLERPGAGVFDAAAPQGVGLGLQVCRWIAHMHDGTLRLEPNEGRGVTAVVRLPSS